MNVSFVKIRTFFGCSICVYVSECAIDRKMERKLEREMVIKIPKILYRLDEKLLTMGLCSISLNMKYIATCFYDLANTVFDGRSTFFLLLLLLPLLFNSYSIHAVYQYLFNEILLLTRVELLDKSKHWIKR